MHTNFKISSENESLFLSSNDGILVDEIELIGLPPDSSIGYSNFSGEIVSFLETTPGYRNSDEEFIASIQNEVFFSETGGLKSEIVNLELSGNDSSQEIRYTLDGSEPNMQSSLYQYQITVSENKSVRARIFQKNYIASYAFKLGLLFYDFLGGRKKSEKHKNISKKNTFVLFPKLRKVNLKKSFIFQTLLACTP